jgi:hypothetical protein
MTERKRATGFALLDAAFAADAKFVKLARRAASPHDYAAAVGVYFLLLGDARRGKSPAVDWDDYEEYAWEIAELKQAKLLLPDGFDPDVFERWAPAYRSVAERAGTVGYAGVPSNGAEHAVGYGGVPSGTKRYDISGLVLSTPEGKSEGEGGLEGEGAGKGATTFMGFRSKPGFHDGHHGPSCLVCASMIEEGRAVNPPKQKESP